MEKKLWMAHLTQNTLGAFLVSRRYGSQITLEEARGTLEPFGAISKVEIPDARTQEATGIRGAVLVEFSNFDLSRDLPAVGNPKTSKLPDCSLTKTCVVLPTQ